MEDKAKDDGDDRFVYTATSNDTYSFNRNTHLINFAKGAYKKRVFIR